MDIFRVKQLLALAILSRHKPYQRDAEVDIEEQPAPYAYFCHPTSEKEASA